MGNNEKVKEEFLSRVEYIDRRIEYFFDNYDSWIEALPNDVRCIIIEMLKYFDYYSHEKANDTLKILHNRLNEQYYLKDNNLLHTYLKKPRGKYNSSIEYYIEYRRINNLSNEFFCDDIDELSKEEWNAVNNIVIIDDFCGSGKSLQTYIKNRKKDFNGKTIYYLVMHAMENSKRIIEEIKSDYNIDIVIVALNVRGKAFEYDSINKIEDANDIIKDCSDEIGVPPNYTFGFDDSQALVAFHNNTPNNTIGLFWFNNENYKSIFPREFNEQPTWKVRPSVGDMKKNKRNRKTSNYNARKRNG